ncbi:flagellar hook-length control protein FliK [Methyloraptor flagellatus]|uniref:Flagellar hook-length control protein FliK n=1 Tax=Methyloraptor flagellatus TaxID=3162530 RepID=A0AAU7XEX3_9HYPH
MQCARILCSHCARLLRKRIPQGHPAAHGGAGIPRSRPFQATLARLHFMQSVAPGSSGAPRRGGAAEVAIEPVEAVFARTLAVLGEGNPTLAAGRVIEARVIALENALATLATRFGTLSADLTGATGAALAPGDTLRLSVGASDEGGLPVLTILAPSAGDKPVAAGPTAADLGAALADAVGRAAARQDSLAPAFAAAQALAQAKGAGVPDAVRALAARIVGTRLGDGKIDAATVRSAFLNSGVFLEAKLADGASAPATTQDLKAAFAGLKTAIEAWIGRAAVGGAGPTAGASAGAGAGAAVSVAGGGAGSGSSAAVVGAGNGVAAADKTAASAATQPAAENAPQSPADLRAAAAAAAYAGARRPGLAALAGAPQPAAGTASPGAATDAALGAAGRSPGQSGGVVPAGAQSSNVAPAAVGAGAAQPIDLDGAPLAATSPGIVPAAGQPGAAGRGLDPAALLGSGDDGAAKAGLDPNAAGGRPANDDPAGPGAARAEAPRRGQPLHGQPPAALDPAITADPKRLGAHAAEAAESAVQRIVLEQYASIDPAKLSGQPRDADQVRQTGREWTFEVPIAARDGTAMMQVRVERDGRGRSGPEAPGEPTIRVRFSIDMEPIGAVHARIGFSGGRLAIGLWAERPEVAAALGAEVGDLRGALEAAALPVDEIRLAAGTPPRDEVKPSTRIVDLSL